MPGVRRKPAAACSLMAALVLVPMLSGCTAAPAFNGEAGDHFDGTQFVNRDPMDKSAGDFVKLAWGAVTDASDWPRWVETSQGEIPSTRVYQGISTK